MTELINNQKITPNDINRKGDNQQLLSSDDENSNRILSDMGTVPMIPQDKMRHGSSSEYVNTDDENDDHQFQKRHKIPEDRKVVS